MSWTDAVYLTVAGHRVSLNSNYEVTINGTTVQPPTLVQPYLFIDATTNHILVNTHIGEQHLYLNLSFVLTYSRTVGIWIKGGLLFLIKLLRGVTFCFFVPHSNTFSIA